MPTLIRVSPSISPHASRRFASVSRTGYAMRDEPLNQEVQQLNVLCLRCRQGAEVEGAAGIECALVHL